VVVQVADTGPDSCVEHVAGKRIIDASPVVAYDLFAVSCLGWSDARTVQATVVPSSTPLGPCTQHGECSTAPPAAAGGSGTGAWTCSADRSARARCIDNQHLECDECPAGAMCATSGGSSVCPSAADGGTPDAGSDASVTDAHADGSGDATGDAGSDGAAPDAPDAAAGDVAVARDAPCEGGDVCGRGVVMHAGCGCRAPARSTSVGAIGWMLVVAIALGRGRWRRRSA
jgi:hypothetical protein